MTRLVFYMDESLHFPSDKKKRRFGFFGLLGGEASTMSRIEGELSDIRKQCLYGDRADRIRTGQELKWSFPRELFHDVSRDALLEATAQSVELFVSEARQRNIAFSCASLQKNNFDENDLTNLSDEEFSILVMAPIIEAFYQNSILKYGPGFDFNNFSPTAFDIVFDESRFELDIETAALLHSELLERLPPKKKSIITKEEFIAARKAGTRVPRDPAALRVYTAKSHENALLQMSDLLIGYVGYLNTRTNLDISDFLSPNFEETEGKVTDGFYDIITQAGRQSSFRQRQLQIFTDSILALRGLGRPSLSKAHADIWTRESIKHCECDPTLDPKAFIAQTSEKIEAYRDFIQQRFGSNPRLPDSPLGLKYSTPKPKIFD